ncbi:MAG: flagellar basal body L-ring protein FlgH [Gammaproteobacteria bacterium]|nr:flagellar basal body L-ring protein FlgH [Gammaproteobacteria bacterium]
MSNTQNRLTRYAGLLLLLTSLLLQAACVDGPLFRVKKDPYAPSKPQIVDIPRKNNGAIYQQGMTVGLFDNRTARDIGDILTIELVETANASAKSSTKTKKENSVDMPSPTVAGDKVTKEGRDVLSNSVDAGRDFSGSGDTSQSHSLNGKITVTVAEVLPNRNLVVKGQKLLTMNQASEYIRFSGIVRQEDIRPDNTVLSSRVADANIIYGDSGDLSSANTMGPLGKFFQSKAYPF